MARPKSNKEPTKQFTLRLPLGAEECLAEIATKRGYPWTKSSVGKEFIEEGIKSNLTPEMKKIISKAEGTRLS